MSFNFAALNEYNSDEESYGEVEEVEQEVEKKKLKSKHQQLAEIFEEEDKEANLAEAEKADDGDFTEINPEKTKEEVTVGDTHEEDENSIDFAFQIILPFKLTKLKNEKVISHTVMTHFKKYLRKNGRDKLLSKYNDKVTDIYPGFFNILLGKIGLNKDFVLKHDYLSKRIENEEKTKKIHVKGFENRILVKLGAKPEYIIKTKELLTKEQLLRYKMVPQALQDHNNTQAKLAEKKARKLKEEQEGETEEAGEDQEEKPVIKFSNRRSLRGKWVLKCDVSDNYESIVRKAVDSMLEDLGLGNYESMLDENNNLKNNDVIMKPLEIVPSNELAMTIAKYDRSPGYIGMHKNLLRIEKNTSSNEEIPTLINCHSIFLSHYGGEKHYDTVGGIDTNGYMLEPRENKPTTKTRNLVFNFTSPPRKEEKELEPEPFLPSKAAKKKKKKNKKKN